MPRSQSAFAMDGGATPTKAGARSRRPARIVIVGEFNSGKTAMVNLLLGAPVLAPSIVAHTLHPTLVAFASKPSLSAETADRRRTPVTWDRLEAMTSGEVSRVHVGVPLQRLKRFCVIDTPGLGFADSQSDQRSLVACRNADAVIWCTPAMQAWKASEESAWLQLPQRVRRRGVLAVTFADEIASSSDIARLLQRLRAEAGLYFRAVVLAEECPAAVLPDAL